MKSKLGFMVGAVRQALTRKAIVRNAAEVIREYDTGWRSFAQILAAADTLNAWLNIDRFDVGENWFNVDGALFWGRYNASQVYRERLAWALDQYFSGANSVIEYGAGLGRNLLFLKARYPHLQCYGYELVQEGVGIAQAAAKKFGLDVKYAQLDYLNDPAEKFVFPDSDVAFTLFSLEQLPENCDRALSNILKRARLGSIHIEPVTENYPFTFRGLIGRIDHAKAGYLRGFPAAAHRQARGGEWHERTPASHNPLMWPSLYVLKN